MTDVKHRHFLGGPTDMKYTGKQIQRGKEQVSDHLTAAEGQPV